MSRRWLGIAALLLLGGAPVSALAQARVMALPPHPAKTGVDLATALEQRRTTRAFSPRELSPADLSALLWAGNGVNRPDGKRTAPSAHGQQYMALYLVSKSDVWLYDPAGNRLVWVRSGNFKETLSEQPHVGNAPEVLVLVGELDRLDAPEDLRRAWIHATAGTIAQNVALMAAARGIGTGLVGGFNRSAVSQALKLSAHQEPLYLMPLGHLP